MDKKYNKEVTSSTHSPLEDHYSKQNNLNSEASKSKLETCKIKLDPLTPNDKEHTGK